MVRLTPHAVATFPERVAFCGTFFLRSVGPLPMTLTAVVVYSKLLVVVSWFYMCKVQITKTELILHMQGTHIVKYTKYMTN